MSTGSSRFTDDIARILRNREQIDGHTAEALIQEVVAEIEDYRREQERLNDPDIAAVERWLVEAQNRVETLRQWIEQGPSASAERCSAEFLEHLAKQQYEICFRLALFNSSMHALYDPWKPSHRPRDDNRRSMEEGVGFRLYNAGVKLTTSPDGTFAQVLQCVHEEVGFRSPNARRLGRHDSKPMRSSRVCGRRRTSDDRSHLREKEHRPERRRRRGEVGPSAD